MLRATAGVMMMLLPTMIDDDVPLLAADFIAISGPAAVYFLKVVQR